MVAKCGPGYYPFGPSVRVALGVRPTERCGDRETAAVTLTKSFSVGPLLQDRTSC